MEDRTMKKELAENIISQIKKDKAQQATITLKSGKEIEFNPTDDDCRLMKQPIAFIQAASSS